MRLLPANRSTRALTFIEVLFLAVVLLVLTALLLTFVTKWRNQSSRTACQNNLKDVTLAFRIWAYHNDDKFPYATTNCLAYTNDTQAWLHYFVISNELGSPRMLICPQDASRLTNMAMDFTGGPAGLQSKTNRAVSYFVGLEADWPRFPDALMNGDRNILAKPEAAQANVLSLATNTPFLWGGDLHTNRGNITLAEGSVESLDRWGLRSRLGSSGLGTNRLLLPIVR